MVCKYCGSTNIKFQAISDTKTKKKRGFKYWLFIGWWLEPILWFFLAFPKILWEIFANHDKTVTKVVSYAVCQNCGKSWKS